VYIFAGENKNTECVFSFSHNREKPWRHQPERERERAKLRAQHAAATDRFFVDPMFDPPSKFLLLLLFPAGPPFSSSSLSCLLLSLLLLLLLFALASGAKKFVLRNLVPHALHKHGLLAGPRLHCGESNAPQWSHGPPGLHHGGNSLVVPPGPATATLFAGPPLALSSPPLFAFSFFFSFCEADVALLLASFFLFFAFGEAELFVSPPPFVAVTKVSFVVLGLALPSFALSVPSEFCAVIVAAALLLLLLLFGPSRDGPLFAVNLFSSSCSATL
jgi:hypothetical protein